MRNSRRPGASCPHSGNPTGPGLPSGPNIVFFHVLTEGRCKARLADGRRHAGARGGRPGHAAARRPPPARQRPAPAADAGRQPGAACRRRRASCASSTAAAARRPVSCAAICAATSGCAGRCSRTLPRILRVPLGEAHGACLAHEPPAGRDAGNGRRAGPAEGPCSRSCRSCCSSRRCAATSSSCRKEETGWLAGLRDRFVGRALALLHERPDHAWTVEALADEVGLSRSALAQRFTDIIGQGADAIPDALAPHHRRAAAAQRARQSRPHRGRQRLRLRRGIQPRFQARLRHDARSLAQGRFRSL